MIDVDNLRYPVFDRIISTCRRNPSMEEYKNIENNMDIIINESYEFGHISEEVYDRLGIAKDRDGMGREVMRDATISQESYQRTKCLTHEHQIHLRKERLSQNQRIENERKELANRKHNEKIARDDLIVKCLCKKLEVGKLFSDAENGMVNVEYMERCTLEMFASLKCDELDAFIMARQHRDKPVFTAKSKIPKKGTLSEAALGDRNKIRIAFDCQGLRNTFSSDMPYNIGLSDEEDGFAVDKIGILEVSLGWDGVERVLPSHLLSDSKWVRLVVNLLDLEEMNVTTSITHQQKDKADRLVRFYKTGLSSISCVESMTRIKRAHWSMQFAYNNLTVCAACMVLSNHVKNEIKFIQDGDCILAPNTHNFYQCTRFPDCEGAYLYFDSNKGCFIRSGKVTRRGFIARGK